MTIHILVHAVFHDNGNESARQNTYTCLEGKGWHKIHDHRITTLWSGRMDKATSINDGFTAANKDFHDCASKNRITVNIVVQVGTTPEQHF
jgi:hypothetical protein